MIGYIAFLRAINVSGQRIIKMEDLRQMLAMSGIKNVRTYIQSGNVLFESGEPDAEILTKKIEKQLFKALGYEVETFLRTNVQLEEIVQKNLFKNENLSKALKLYVSFLNEDPAAEQKKILESFSNELEQFKIKGREVYALCRKDTTEKLRFSNMFVEKKLGLWSTGRDWNTINKILEL